MYDQIEHGTFVQQRTETLFFEMVVVPFLDFLKLIVLTGGDPHACVGKIEFYRELDVKKL